MDESEAVARLRRGDIAGLEPLVARYQVQATRAAYLVLRDTSPDPSNRGQPATAPEPDTLALHAETADEIGTALGKLNPKQRAAIVQRY